MAEAPWSDLPTSLLEEIFKKLLLTDLPTASSVCSSWRSSGLQVIRGLLTHFVGLIVPGQNPEGEIRRLLLPKLESNVCSYNDDDANALNISVPHRYYCCGSGFGWLVLIDDSLDMHLLNPLSGSRIELPSGTTAGSQEWRIERFGKSFVDKAFLSCKPASLSQTYALVIVGERLAVCRLGDKVWTCVENPGPGFRCYMDAVYYKDKFYVVYSPGPYLTIDINADPDHPVVKDYGLTPPGELIANPRYLVESNGELFQIRRYINHDGDEIHESDNENKVVFDWAALIDNRGGADNEDEDSSDGGEADEDIAAKDGDSGDGVEAEEDENDGGEEEEKDEDQGKDDDHREWARRYQTIRFKIFKLRDCKCGRSGWEKVESIGDRAFFVGSNTSFSLSASDFPGYRANSVYFTDKFMNQTYYPEPVRHDIGVYSLEDKTVEHIYPIDSKPVRPIPFWFAPSHGKC